jgi:hypothetical protein
MLPIRDGPRKSRTGTCYVPGIAPNRTEAVEFTVCRFAGKSVNTSRHIATRIGLRPRVAGKTHAAFRDVSLGVYSVKKRSRYVLG